MTNVSLSHRDAASAPDLAQVGEQGRVSPPAQRPRVQRWRDPRLWVGVVLVIASMLLGAKLLAASDNTVAVWAADDALPAGSPVTASDVHVVRVHFGDAADADAYLPAEPGDAFAGSVAARDVAAGELLTQSALSSGIDPPDQLPLAVTEAGMPSGLGTGDRVDVWAVPSADQVGDGGRSKKVLDHVIVSAVGSAGPGGLGSTRAVLVALPAHTDVGAALDNLRGSDVVLIRVGG